MSKTDRLHLGVDIGGSSVKFAVLERRNKNRIKILYENSLKTPHDRNKLIQLIVDEIRILEEKYDVRFIKIGVAVAGAMNVSRTKILHSPNIKQLNGFALPTALNKKLARKYLMENDANLFVFAEAFCGVAKGYSSVAGMTLGTGVGSGFLLNGKILTGAHGGGAELGHTVVNADGIKCSCGGSGHLEEYISARAIKRYGFATQEELLKKVRLGNKKAVRLFNEISFYLGYAFANIMNIWDPDIIVVGGGIAEKAEFLLQKAARSARKEILSEDSARALTVRKAKLGSYAGAVGAALFVNSDNNYIIDKLK